MTSTSPICMNPQHDHLECAGAEVRADTAPASATDHGDGVATLTEAAPMLCADCAKPTHYDRDAETYVHDDPAAECFLHGPGIPTGGTPCQIPSPTLPRLRAIAERLNGKLVAYNRVTADEHDERYVIAYSFAPGAWCVAAVDAASGDYLHGTSQRATMTADNVSSALADEKAIAATREPAAK